MKRCGLAFAVVLLSGLLMTSCRSLPASAEKEVRADLQRSLGIDPPGTLHYVSARAGRLAREKLDFDRNAPHVLVLTDAGCPVIGGRTTEACLDGLIASTGCTPGKANLLVLQRPKWERLWFAFYNKQSRRALYLEVDEEAVWLPPAQAIDALAEGLFSRIEDTSIDLSKLPDFGGNEFGIATAATVWAKGVPYDFLRAVELHNHACPGIISGYMIVHYLEEHLPVRKPSESYTVIACPPWCKDDAFQAAFDATAGKRRMIVKSLSQTQSQRLPKGVAGIYIRWNKESQTGDGLVLAFNWDKCKRLCKWDAGKARMNLLMLDYLDRPETFVRTVHEFSLDSQDGLDQLQRAGVDPYAALGLYKE